MENTTISIYGSINLKYDPKDQRVKDTLKEYKASIHKDAEWNDVLEHVTYNILRAGYERMIEGVGYIHVNNQYQGQPNDNLDSGIYLGDSNELELEYEAQ